MDRWKFHQQVYQVVSEIPFGKVASYGQTAFLAGYPGYARQVGRALQDAPQNLGLPCHRVVTSAGRLVPGWTEQKTLLEAEKVRFRASGKVDMKHFMWLFS